MSESARPARRSQSPSGGRRPRHRFLLGMLAGIALAEFARPLWRYFAGL